MWNTPTGVGCAGFTQFQFDSLKVWKVLEGATCFITYKCEGVEFQSRCWATKLRTRGCSSLFWISLEGSFLSEVIMEASAGLQLDINSVHVSHLDSTVKYSVTDTFIFDIIHQKLLKTGWTSPLNVDIYPPSCVCSCCSARCYKSSPLVIFQSAFSQLITVKTNTT